MSSLWKFHSFHHRSESVQFKLLTYNSFNPSILSEFPQPLGCCRREREG